MTLSKNSPDKNVKCVDGNGNERFTQTAPGVVSVAAGTLLSTTSPGYVKIKGGGILGTTYPGWVKLEGGGLMGTTYPGSVKVRGGAIFGTTTPGYVKFKSGNYGLFTATTPGYVNPTTKTILTAKAIFGRHSTNTTFPIVAAVASNKITVIGMFRHSLETRNLTLLDSTTKLVGPLTCTAAVDYTIPQNTHPTGYWFQTTAGNALRGSLSSTDTTITLIVNYYTTT